MPQAVNVKGKSYGLRDDFNGREGWREFTDLAKTFPSSTDQLGDYDKIVGIMTRMVVSWEWPGQPSDPKAWDAVPSGEIFMLYGQVNEALVGRPNG